MDCFNSGFEKLTGKYVGLLKVITNKRLVTFGLLVVFSFGIFGITKIIPGCFVPQEDQGKT